MKYFSKTWSDLVKVSFCLFVCFFLGLHSGLFLSRMLKENCEMNRISRLLVYSLHKLVWASAVWIHLWQPLRDLLWKMLEKWMMGNSLPRVSLPDEIKTPDLIWSQTCLEFSSSARGMWSQNCTSRCLRGGSSSANGPFGEYISLSAHTRLSE